ncbi:MAG: peptidylprolyl isomerase [Bradymonadia bacterium]
MNRNLRFKVGGRFFASLSVVVLLLPGVMPGGAALRAEEAEGIQTKLARVKLLETTRRKELSVWKSFLKSKNLRIRLAAIRGVGQAGVTTATSLLRNAVNDQDASIQDAALFSLLQLEELDTSVLESSVLSATDEALRARRIRLLGLAAESASEEFVTKILLSKEPQSHLNLVRALRQRAKYRTGEPVPLSGRQLVDLFKTGHESLRVEVLRIIQENTFTSGPWQTELGALCGQQTVVSVVNECLLSHSKLKMSAAFFNVPAVTQPMWSTQVALSSAYADGENVSKLIGQIEGNLAGIKDASIPLETANFYGVIRPIEISIGMAKNKELKKAGENVYNAIELDGVSVNDATGALGLSLSHLHCAAAALMDRHLERVKYVKRCGATDYGQPLRDMWMVKSVMNWPLKNRARWFARGFKTLAPRAQILTLELAEGQDPDFLKTLLEQALASEVPAVAGIAAKIIGRSQVEGLEAELVSTYRRTLAQREFSVVEAIITALGRLSYETAEILFSRHREDPHTGIREAAIIGLAAIEQKRLRHNHIDRLETMQLGRRSFEPPPAAILGAEKIDSSLIVPPPFTRFKVRTTKGTFDIELKPEWAVLATKKLVSLAGQKFFDGQSVTIRRDGDLIVGDPSGLGWDGKGRNVPDERSPEEVLAGSVILDRSGRDTATSRLLITRQDRPDLYGMVNLVGRVRQGGEGLSAVVEGDRILDIQPELGSIPASKGVKKIEKAE